MEASQTPTEHSITGQAPTSDLFSSKSRLPSERLATKHLCYGVVSYDSRCHLAVSVTYEMFVYHFSAELELAVLSVKLPQWHLKSLERFQIISACPFLIEIVVNYDSSENCSFTVCQNQFPS